MPKTKDTSNHPCHFLSLPSAKRFWCRHCMSVFEDAITRWRHSRSCRYGVVNNFMRRRQLEAKALQNTTKPNPIEARLEQSVSPSEEPIPPEEVQGTSTAGEKSNQATSNDLYRCFICQSKFSTLEEMRHHVKYPCNNKKIITDVPNPAMTVYIDEFTDRSRQWVPQPHQEEVISSEFVPNIVSQETVHSTAEVKNVMQDSALALPQNQESKLTPTNIYVNEQGETVIEVENLDLNAEGGELSLAHLLTQLSQQGIVFDKSKASQMEARPEATLSDPTSGEIYTTGAPYDPHGTMQAGVKEDDEGQPTAEDAANTLAQLSVFRGYNRANVGTQEVQTTDMIQKEYVVEGTGVGYTYVENYPGGDHQLPIENAEGHQNIKVEYDYSYLPSQPSTNDGSTPQISLQPSFLDPANASTANIETVKDNNTVDPLPTMHFPRDIQQQVVTYISTPSTLPQQSQAAVEDDGTVLIENVVMEDQTMTAPHQQYHMSIAGNGGQDNDHKVSIAGAVESSQDSYIVLNTEDNATQIVCDHPGNQHEIAVRLNSVGEPVICSDALSSNHNHHHQQQQQYIPTSNVGEDGSGEIKDTEEFEVQTVTLQEIAENESAGTVSFHHSTLSTEPSVHADNIASNSNGNNDLRASQLVGNQCVQLDILQQTANSIMHSEGGLSEPVEHQAVPGENVSSDSSTVPMYVVSADGGLQLLTSTQDGQTVSQEHVVLPSPLSHS